MIKFELYQDAFKLWRWRIRRMNNYKILADSGEGYVNRSDAEYAINLIKNYAYTAPVNMI